jgi:hypothetical protein
MNLCVISQGNTAGKLLATLIAEEQSRGGVEVRVATGQSSFYSYARTLLAVKRIPVAVVMDADTPEPEAALERQQSAEEVIGDAASGVPFRVIVAVPSLDILFFQRPELLRRVFGDAINEHVMELAQLSPKRTIQKLAPDQSYEDVRTELLRAMDASDVQALRESPPIRDLRDFIAMVVGRSSLLGV